MSEKKTNQQPLKKDGTSHKTEVDMENSIVGPNTTPDTVEVVTQSVEKVQDKNEKNTPTPQNWEGISFGAFQKQLEQETNIDVQLEQALAFMEYAISQQGTPHFKDFWDVRKSCLELFKKKVSPALRVSFWEKYSELSKEARQLKEILDEQSAFAVEQIEKAIFALEQDVSKEPSQEKLGGGDLELFQTQILSENASRYKAIYQSLSLYNAYAGQTNGLRKELLNTEMRIRKKNEFFKRLSKTGDQIFPQRKALIKEVSDLFVEDVKEFKNRFFSEEIPREASYKLKDDIKTLQALAKKFTLSTQAFSSTRQLLSECWDHLKEFDKERKQKALLHREDSKKNLIEVEKLIQEFSEKYSETKMSAQQAEKEIEQIQQKMRNLQLIRDDVKTLKEKIAEARQLIQKEMAKERADRQALEEKKEQERQQVLQDVQNKTNQLLEEALDLSIEEITSQRKGLLEEIRGHQLLRKGEKQLLERSLKSLKDILTQKKEQAILSLSEDDRQAFDAFKELLVQCQENRKEVKSLLADLQNRSKGSSGLNFEEAIALNEQVAEEKEQLAKVNVRIFEIERKIKELASKI